MARTLSVELTDAEWAALCHIAVDPDDWFQDMVKLRCKNTIHEIANQRIKQMLDDPAVTSIPADKEVLFNNLLAAGEIKTAASMNEESVKDMMTRLPTAMDLTPETPALDTDLNI